MNGEEFLKIKKKFQEQNKVNRNKEDFAERLIREVKENDILPRPKGQGILKKMEINKNKLIERELKGQLKIGDFYG